jgi:Abortive infection alpha
MMSDQKPSDDLKNIADAAKAGAEIVKGLMPIYHDALQPLAKELGKAGGSLGSAGNAVISALSDLVVWGTDKTKSFLVRVVKKLEGTPADYINKFPKPSVIVPALEAVRLTEGEPDLQELYANLLARAMDTRVADGIFPSFVEILKQLTSDEAKILRFFQEGTDKGSLVVPIIHIQQEEFDNNNKRVGGLDVVKNRSLLGGLAGCVYPNQVPSYLDNLARLGIIVFLTPGTEYANKSLYRDVEADPAIAAELRRYHQPPRFTAKPVRTGLELTTFGRHFISACVAPYGPT